MKKQFLKLLNSLGRRMAGFDWECQMLHGYFRALKRNPALLDRRCSRALKPKPALLDHRCSDIARSSAGWSEVAFMVNDLVDAQIGYQIPALEKAVGLLENDADKNAYRAELAFLKLRHLNNGALAHLISPFSKAEFERQTQVMRQMVSDGRIPFMHGDTDDMTEGYMGFSLTATFAIGQYRYDPYVKVAEGDVFLDCGACFGETAVWALSQGAAQVYSFEPNTGYYRLLEKNAAQAGSGRLTIFPYGLGKTDQELWFQEQGAASKIVADRESADYSIQVTSVDNFCARNGVAPDFIKMDIEGFELEALEGARNTIQKFKPKLAVCLYHEPAHMWEIPLFLDSLKAGYSFWCRKNHFDCEFVLYAAAPGAG